ncbi:MAG: TRAP transporter substrate-binding protein [Burkholderiaceae bacterium]|nr:TRAP transporter substrate-binding protein [Burkholderiaceae bacterium]MEB2349831.1 TRAP transporter substrate-binding protein [Burkholderiaceae bacterium]
MKPSRFLSLLLAVSAGTAFAQVKWDLPAAYPASNFHTENLVQFAADVDKATSGKLKITIHANASLFKAPEIKRAVQGNQAQIGEVLLSNFSNENPLYGVDVLPFLATSYEAARKLDRAARPALDRLLASQGMKLLYTVAWPPQGLYSKKALDAASDLKGVKFRSYNAATAKIAEMFGAQPVTIQAAELSQAMATGAVESFITSGSTGYDTKAYEHIKYFYDTQAWLPKNAVIVNQKAFDALDKATQSALLGAAAAAETRGWKSSEEKTVWYLDQLKKNGMQVLPPSARMTAEFRKVGDALVDDWLKKTGTEGKTILDAYGKM